MSGDILPRNRNLRGLSTELRNNATKEENRLWYEFLRLYPVRFNRQRIIGEYIVDFYCARARLVIELDGSQHYEPVVQARDTVRERCLKEMGIVVVRFTNLDLRKDFSGVCAEIDRQVKLRVD